MKSKTLFKSIMYILQGAIVGVGTILPGVSGGVLCVAFGIYKPMMKLFTHPIKSFKENYKLFIPFLIGWVLGFILLARIVEKFFSSCPTIALMLFFGLICGTLPELFKVSEKSDPSKSWTPFVISLAFAYLLFQILDDGISAAVAPSFGSYLMSGVVWGLSLIIPGLSSSSVLLYLGLYEPLTAGIGSLDFSVIVPFIIGIGGTALLLARVVTMLFNKYYAVISRIILGFVIASSLKILPVSFENPLVLAISIACFSLGFALSRGMDCAKAKRNI